MAIDQIIAILGGEVALLGLFCWIMKRIIGNAIDNAFKTSLDKNLESYKDELARANAVRKLLIEKELFFYGKADKHMAELVPLIQDIRNAVVERIFGEFEKECILKYLRMIPKMKDLYLQYEPYVDKATMESYKQLVLEMQNDAERWSELISKISAEDELTVDEVQSAHEMCDSILLAIAETRVNQYSYLKEAAGLS